MIRTLSDAASDIASALALGAISKLPPRLLERLSRKFAPQVIERIVLGDPYGGNAGRFDEQFRQAYASNMWVYRCVSVIAQNIAQAPLGIYETVTVNGKRKTRALSESPVQECIDHPNAYMSEYDLAFLTVAFLELTGNAFWLLARLEGGPRASQVGAIVCLRPTRVRVVPGERAGEPFIKGYEYRLGNDIQQYDAEDVIHFKYPNPNDDYRGQSTLEAARDTYLEDRFARAYNQAFYRNAAMPKGGLQFESELDKSDYRRIRSEWNAQHAGVDNAHKIAIFEQGSKWVNIGLSQKDMDFINQRKLSRDDMGAIFGVPPVLLNSYERATYNNADRQVAFFWHETEIPKTRLLSETLTSNAWKFFGRRSIDTERLSFAFDLADIWALKREALDDAKTQIELVKSGLRTQNELRERDNLDAVAWGDVWWRSNALVATSDADSIEPAAAQGKMIKPVSVSALVARGPSRAIERCAQVAAGVDAHVDLSADRWRAYLLAEWRAHIISTDHFERLFRGFIESLFKDQLRLMQRNLREIDRKMIEIGLAASDLRIDKTTGIIHFETKRKPRVGDVESIVFDKARAEQFTKQASDPLYRRIVKAGGQRAFVLSETAGTFDMLDPQALAHMLFKQQKLAREVNDTTWDAVTRSLTDGITEGDSIQMLSDRINDVMLDRISTKHNIARTEVQGAMNGGLHDGFDQTGIVSERTWSTAGDEVVRDAHRDVNGTTLPLKDKFKLVNKDGSTSELLYPGDPEGSAEQVINCRCTEVPAKRRS